MNKTVAPRDAKMDNLKALLIFLVVFGHVMEAVMAHSGAAYALTCIIYSFHMPMFAMVSGYFFAKSGALAAQGADGPAGALFDL